MTRRSQNMAPEAPRLVVDPATGSVTVGDGEDARTYPLYSPEAFRLISDVWVRVGWDQKYVYSFTWLGRPVIQLPDDLLRVQEVIASIRPDVIVETGVAHGGSLVFYASLCRVLGHGRVVGVDVEIRPHNRKAIEEHPLSDLIALVEGDSTDPETVARVAAEVGRTSTAIVMLDSNHTRDHVLAELRAYSDFVTPGSYLVVMDGIMERVVGSPRANPDWATNNPLTAVAEFLREDPRFVVEEPPFAFNEGVVTERVTHWPGGYLKRVG